MTSALYLLALAALGAAGYSSAAEPPQSWHVAGKVESFSFTLNCDLRPAGMVLGGVCVDAATSDPTIKGGRSHTITRGRIDGDTVSWTYPSSFLLSQFDVTFNGTRRGKRMIGVIHVQGHDGAFTATRQ
jgi:hypothetical protein